MRSEHRCRNATELADALAASLAGALRSALAERGVAALVVSGGRTPAPLLAALSHADLDWPRVWVTLADERWVPPDHPDSNAALVHEHLLQQRAAAARFVPLKNSAPTPALGASLAAAALRAIPRPFDAVVLGLGDDGHTASLFPGAPGLAAALDMSSRAPCAPIDPVTAPHPRLTLTLRALLDSRRVALVFGGDAKWAVYRQALEPGAVAALPIRGVLQQETVPVDVYWHP